MKEDRRLFEETMKLEKEEHKQWYHTIDLGGEVTDGIYDISSLWEQYQFPNLKNKRVLDIGCADGYFSFEFEKFGAKVTAIDAYHSDLFEFAKRKLNSKVKYKIIDVYDINSDNIGFFDFVFCGTMLLHLENPLKALENIRHVIKKGLFVCTTPTYHSWLTMFYKSIIRKPLYFAKFNHQRPSVGYVPTYWVPTEDCLNSMLYRSGFNNIVKKGNFWLDGYSKATDVKEHHYHTVFHCEVK
jgi:SAM-dependent methyltransferase